MQDCRQANPSSCSECVEAREATLPVSLLTYSEDKSAILGTNAHRSAFRAEGSVLTVLGAQRNPEDLQYLLQVAKDDKKIGQHAIVRAGALRGKQCN